MVAELLIDDLRDYPRPSLRRAEWESLNGPWDFALDPEQRWTEPDQVFWDRTIQVPFAPETPASGIGDIGFHPVCWYRRQITVEPLPDDRLQWLNFGAVDYRASVWLNGRHVADHEGGYTPFQVDCSPLLRDGTTALEIVVRSEDDPQDFSKPRGKQEWQSDSHAIFYPRTSGIWQTVWLERTAHTYFASIYLRGEADLWWIDLEAEIAGPRPPGLTCRLAYSFDGKQTVATGTAAIDFPRLRHRMVPPVLDEAEKKALLWSPDNPVLLELTAELIDSDGQVLDRIGSYTAMRTLGMTREAFLLNGEPLQLRLVLDQGYWPETGLTPPNSEALCRDIELAQQLGFNGVRKHQKIEDPRFLFWADVMGLLVWEEMPSARLFTDTTIQRLTNEWMAVIRRDRNHPCIITWVPFNESWGVPNLPTSAQERDFVAAIYALTWALDPTRSVSSNDGWEQHVTDLVGIHDYTPDPASLADRYGVLADIPRRVAEECSHGRELVLPGYDLNHLPHLLSEFGGIAFTPRDQVGSTWGYSRAGSEVDLLSCYQELLAAVHAIPTLIGFCYTQLTDTYQEANGLLYADRTPKADIGLIRGATTGVEIPVAVG